MALEQEKTLNDYINIIRRRFPYVLAFFFLAFLISLVFAIKKPPIYQSTGTILIESQQVRLGQEKERYANERFAALKQVVLSNENLFKIAENYKLFDLDKIRKASPESMGPIVRSHITVALLKAEAEGWEPQRTFAFQVSANYYDADSSYNMANDLVKLFLDENDRASKALVTETADFIGKEAEKRKAALEKIEKEVTNYKQSHSSSLPENKDVLITSLERLGVDLRAVQREYSATQAELRSLDVSLESARAGIGLNTLQERIAGPTDLDGLKLELAKQKSIYSDNHPSVRVLQRRIDILEKNAPVESDKPVKAVTAQSVMVAKVQTQIDTANARLKSLEMEEAGIRAKINQTEGRILQSSQTEGALTSLLRDYENAKAAYAEIKAKQDEAKIAKNIQIANKGERFVLIEAPIFPEKPIAPNRILIILAGFFGSIFAAIGLALAMDALDKRVRGVDALASIMKIQPMATIPYITNKAEIKRNKYMVFNILVSVLIVTLLVLFLIHIFFMPLDVLTTKILSRF